MTNLSRPDTEGGAIGGPMTFSEFLSKGWSDHGDHPEQLADRLEEGLSLCGSSDDVIALVNLTTHLYAEHLRKFTEGERKLREFGKSDFVVGSPAEFAIARSIMAFRLCDGGIDPEHDRLGLTPGDLARALATAASALATRDAVRSEKYLRLAIETAAPLELGKTDGLARGLAIAGNNIAANMEEVTAPSSQQITLMLLAAETGRKYWEIAGTWMEVERAEYRFAKSCLKAGKLEEARAHAALCLAVCEQNEAPPLEIFFAYECMASIEKAAASNAFQSALQMAKEWFEKITPENQSWARKSLDGLA